MVNRTKKQRIIHAIEKTGPLLMMIGFIVAIFASFIVMRYTMSSSLGERFLRGLITFCLVAGAASAIFMALELIRWLLIRK